MPLKTDLNVTPYYDDFDKSKNFQQVLARPGYAVQARELTQMQSILRNNIEQLGDFVLQEGSMVVPGQLRLLRNYAYVKIETAYGGETISPAQYKNGFITGQTSGVKAQINHVEVGTSSDQPTFYVRYSGVGTDNTTTVFQDGETLSCSLAVTNGDTAYSADAVSAQVFSTSATGYGTGAVIQDGVYYLRGGFVEVPEQTIILDKYKTDEANGKVGFKITETIVTPEADSTLLDNATGTSNFAAKGAHRIKVEATLTSIDIGSTADSDFIMLMEVRNGDSLAPVNRAALGTIIDTLARRTFDESGDYTVRTFSMEVKESVTLNENEGVFSKGDTTDQGGTASNDLLALKVSPGKAYVRGYEIEKLVNTFVDIPKAREFNSVNSGVVTYDVGNFLNVTNMYGTPDISFISGETTPYKQIDLFDTPTATRGSSSGTRIGVARTRAIEYTSGTAGSSEAVFKMYMFDFRPFTFLTLSDTPSPTLEANHSNGGVQVKGVTSKATGWLWADGTSGGTVILTNVSGTFSAGEKLTASDSAETDSILENSSNADITLTRAITKNVSQVRQLHMTDVDSGQNFTADIVLDADPTTESFVLLDQTDDAGTDVEDHIISELDKLPMGLERAATGGTGSSLKQAKLKSSEKNVSVFKLPKNVIKTHLTTANAGASDTSYYLRKQFVTTSSSVGVVTISAGTGEVFVSHAEVDYVVSILSAGSGGTGQQGDIVSASTGFSGGGTNTVTITNNAVFGNGAKLKITATLLKSSAVAKTKTAKLMKQLKVAGATAAAYGTRVGDKTLSLGRADAFKLVAVLDSESTSSDSTAPVLTLGTVVGNFTKGEEITGSSSGAKGRIIDTSSPMSFVYKRGTKVTFTTNDTITGFSSGATAPITAVATGSTNITDRYELDTGQRDNYYDISRIVRKPGQPAPLGRLLVIYDYLEHGTGDFFTVDSYTDVADQMTYEDIPKYSATKVDPDDPAPSGEYDLQDVFDIRPRAEDIGGTSTNIETVDQVTGNSFDFYHRQFDGTGASTINWIKPGSLITTDFEYYLPYKGRVSITKQGRINFLAGIASEQPNYPEPIKDAMQLATVDIPAFTFRPQTVDVTMMKNRRYTMADIGKLEQRISHVEYYTSLSLLERDAESFEIQDANGLNRFKSGFIVDSFSGHKIGDVKHTDYKCSIDMENNELRPPCVPKGVKMEETATSASARASVGYQKTGDLITLPYDEILFQEQPYATRVERVTPLLHSTWNGKIDLDPEGDEWFETETMPALIVNVEGNFDTFSAENADAVGTVWNAWSTVWSGTTVSSQATVEGAVGTGVFSTITRTTTTQRGTATRTGVQTSIVPQIDLESQGSKVVQRAFIPFMRAVNITFTGFGFFPNIRLYCFFDKKDVNEYCTPLSGYTTDAADVSGVVAAQSPLITSAAGEIKGILAVPDPKIEGNPKFRTGEVEFRLTSSATDVRSKDPETAGQTTFKAVGVLETEQETIIATRNAAIVTQSVSATTNVTSQTTQMRVVQEESCGCGGNDPLAQTFIVSANSEVGATADVLGLARSSGRFLTSIEVYFSAKDENLPVWVEIHNTENGYPGSKILPFARVVKFPADINTSSDATVATKFTFPSPVYLLHEQEYTICLMTVTPEYKVFISRMGETDIGGSRIVSKQPHTGTLFKGHNNRSWAPSMTEDLKFKINVAKFNTSAAGKVTIQNATLDSKTLKEHPLTFTNGNTALLVNHKNHGMYDTSNNVTISGVESGAETTLASAMASDATSLTLTDGTDFNDTSGKFAYDTSSQWFLKIGDEVMKYTTISDTAVSSITRAQDSTSAVSHPAGTKVELYMLHRVPFTEINKTHTSIANINMDSYTVSLSSTPSISGDSTDATNGGKTVKATENASMDTVKPIISAMELPETTLTQKIRPMTSTSPSGVQSPFVPVSTSDAITVDINANTDFDTPYMVASEINESNENGGSKSVFLDFTLSSDNSDVSPVIDTQRMSLMCAGNRLNKIDSSSDVYPTSLYDASTDPNGDDNATVYLTKKVTLENAATALKVFFSGHRHSSAEIEVYYKILRTDDASDFDDLGYRYFNTTGIDDNSTPASADENDFKEYIYTAGVTDDGIGEALEEFVSFQIKIIMQGTNCAEPPRIKDLRALALVT